MTDTERLDFLNELLGRHVMTPCHKTKARPDGLRRDDCRSDVHVLGGNVLVFIRDSIGFPVVSASGADWRAAIDDAHRQAKRLRTLEPQ